MQPPDSPYLTSEEAIVYLRMAELKYPKCALTRLVKSKKLKCCRRGAILLFTKDQLDSLVD